MEEEKSHVGMQRCFICRDEVTAVLLDRRLKNTLTQHEVGMDICDKCQEKYLKAGILCIEAKKDEQGKITVSGRFVVLKDKAFKKFFNVKGKTELKRKCFIDESVFGKFFVKGGGKENENRN